MLVGMREILLDNHYHRHYYRDNSVYLARAQILKDKITAWTGFQENPVVFPLQMAMDSTTINKNETLQSQNLENWGLKLHINELDLSEMKKKMMMTRKRMLFCQGLANGDFEELEKKNANFKEVKTDTRKKKEVLKKLEEKLQDEAEGIGEILSEVAEHNDLDEKIKASQEKILQYREMLAKLTASQESSHTQAEKNETENQELDKLIAAAQGRKTNIEFQVASLEAQCKEEQEKLQEETEKNQKFLDDERDNFQMCEQLLQPLEDGSGIKVISTSECQIRVIIPSNKQKQTSKEEQETSQLTDLELMMTFDDSGALSAAKVSPNSCDAESMICNAIMNNSPSQLLLDLKEMWIAKSPLLNEINELRTRFALDWVQEKQIVKVLYGHGGNMMCTLHLPVGYPSAGQVQLKSASGLPAGLTIEHLVPEESSTLSQWLYYLEDKLQCKNEKSE